MLKPVISVILFAVMLTSCSATDQPDKGSFASDQNQSDCVQGIYESDHQVRAMKNRIFSLRKKVYQIGQEKKFEEAHELKEKIEELEQELRIRKTELEDLLIAYKQNWENQPWWQKMAIETGPQYIHFDNDLNLDDTIGLRIKIHWVRQEFRPFHIGSYLYYPLESDLAYPLRRVEASRFFIEYRHLRSETNHLLQKNVEVNYYLIGFGLLGQTWKDTYIKVNLAGGLQRYAGIQPSDTGPVISYTLGLHQKLSPHLGLELDLTEEILWTKANQGSTHALLNFLAAFVIRYSF